MKLTYANEVSREVFTLYQFVFSSYLDHFELVHFGFSDRPSATDYGDHLI